MALCACAPEATTTSLERSLALNDLWLFLSARFLWNVATQMQSVAIGWEVYALTERPLDLGYVGLAQFLPAAGLALVGGHVADRFDRRRVMLVCYVAFAACAVFFFVRARGLIAPASVWPIYAALVFFGAARAFSSPATQALLPSIVPPERFSRAVAWSSSAWQVATVLGPSIGGALYAASNAPTVYGACTALYAASFALVAALRVRTGRLETREASLRTVLAGLGYVWQKKALLGSISLDLFAVLLGGAVALLPIFAKDVLNAGPVGLGLLRSAPGVGALLTAAVLTVRPIERNAGTRMLACVAIFGAATIVFGVSRSLPLSLLALFIVGASDMVSVVIRMTLVQVSTPSEMRGRVSAVNLVFIGASNELGEFESGFVAQWLHSAIASVVVGGIGTLVVVALWTWRFAELRRFDRLDGVD
jgi:MFS family permease